MILTDYQLQQDETGLEAIAQLQTLSEHPYVQHSFKMLSEQNYPLLFKPVEPQTLRMALFSLLPTHTR